MFVPPHDSIVPSLPFLVPWQCWRAAGGERGGRDSHSELKFPGTDQATKHQAPTLSSWGFDFFLTRQQYGALEALTTSKRNKKQGNSPLANGRGRQWRAGAGAFAHTPPPPCFAFGFRVGFRVRGWRGGGEASCSQPNAKCQSNVTKNMQARCAGTRHSAWGRWGPVARSALLRSTV